MPTADDDAEAAKIAAASQGQADDCEPRRQHANCANPREASSLE